MDEMADRIHETVTHARNLCDNVQWSPMDATRTEWDYLKRVVEIAIKAGATTINIPDTVGYTAPRRSADLIRRLIADGARAATRCLRHPLPQRPRHGDGQRAGGRRGRGAADRMHDQRSGRACGQHRAGRGRDGDEGAPRHHAVHHRHRHHEDHAYLPPRRHGLGLPVQPNKAIVGKNAFAHESGIHQDGMLKIGRYVRDHAPRGCGPAGTSLPLGKHSGRAALRAKLKDLGFDMADNQLNDLFVRFKALADRKKEVFDDDLIALVTDAGPPIRTITWN
jgi:2-isopropylmalate synthase